MLRKIKSKKILKNIFKNLKNRIKLKILKYNKNLLFQLNIQKKDFENYLLLKEINPKYDLNIKDIDIDEFRIQRKY